MPVCSSTARTWLRFTAAALLTLPLAACRYTSFPLAPSPQRAEQLARLTSGTLTRAGDALRLDVTLDPRGRSGFVTVVWYAEERELGRDSAYLDAREPRAVFTLPAAARGEYRAVLSFEDTVLRQFDFQDAP